MSMQTVDAQRRDAGRKMAAGGSLLAVSGAWGQRSGETNPKGIRTPLKALRGRQVKTAARGFTRTAVRAAPSRVLGAVGVPLAATGAYRWVDQGAATQHGGPTATALAALRGTRGADRPVPKDRARARVATGLTYGAATAAGAEAGRRLAVRGMSRGSRKLVAAGAGSAAGTVMGALIAKPLVAPAVRRATNDRADWDEVRGTHRLVKAFGDLPAADRSALNDAKRHQRRLSQVGMATGTAAVALQSPRLVKVVARRAGRPRLLARMVTLEPKTTNASFTTATLAGGLGVVGAANNAKRERLEMKANEADLHKGLRKPLNEHVSESANRGYDDLGRLRTGHRAQAALAASAAVTGAGLRYTPGARLVRMGGTGMLVAGVPASVTSVLRSRDMTVRRKKIESKALERLATSKGRGDVVDKAALIKVPKGIGRRFTMRRSYIRRAPSGTLSNVRGSIG